MSIVQFTRFRLTAGREAAVLAARHASLRACQGSEPELRGAYLIRLPGGEWLDIAVWAGPPGHEFDHGLLGPGEARPAMLWPGHAGLPLADAQRAQCGAYPRGVALRAGPSVEVIGRFELGCGLPGG